MIQAIRKKFDLGYRDNDAKKTGVKVCSSGLVPSAGHKKSARSLMVLLAEL